jgi:hypothetical protein
MVARGVAEMIPTISKEEEEDEASLWREKSSAAKNSCGGSSEIAELSWRRRGERMRGG